jgi:tetratricopeptide (TPR) repeat protein
VKNALPRAAAAIVLLARFGLSGCAIAPEVSRGYGGDVVAGRYIEPEAYAEFLRGAIAEAEGKSGEALAAYDEALRIDPRGVEIWTRVAAVRCAASPEDVRTDEALSRALALDERFGPTWAVKARCALSRGDEATARAAARKAAELDPSADGANVILAETNHGEPPAATREALVALTMTARDPVLAWDALAAWAEAHGDVALRGRAFESLVRIAPSRRGAAARVAEQLALAGQIGQARAVAAAAADAGDSGGTPLASGDYALAARLAVDEAIARGDPALVRERATRVRLTLEEAAARALLAGDPRLAREIASRVALADHADAGVRLVLAAGDRRDVLAALAETGRVRAPVSAAAWVALGEALAFAVPASEARARLASVAHEPVTPGDALVMSRLSSLSSGSL